MYSQVVPVSFKITSAALGPEAGNKEGGIKAGRSVVMLTHQKDGEFALCSLQPNNNHSQVLDLAFLEGETIHLRVMGDNAVHLTGYYFEDANESTHGLAGCYDDEELEAEENGEDLDDYSEENDDEDEDDESDSEMDDFIVDDEEEVDEACESRRTKVKGKPHSRVQEITLEEEDDDDDDDEYESDIDIESESESESEQVKDYSTEDDEQDDSDFRGPDSEHDDGNDDDEEIDSDDAGSVDMSPGKRSKKHAIVSKTSKTNAKRAKVDVQQSPVEIKESPKKENTPVTNTKSPASAKHAVTNAGIQPPAVNKTFSSGLKVEDIKVGAGIKAKKGRMVTISYTVTDEKGENVSSDRELTFDLADTKIAKGMLLGVQGMALGGERRIIVPSNMIDDQTKPKLSQSGNCVINMKLESVKPSRSKN